MNTSKLRKIRSFEKKNLKNVDDKYAIFQGKCQSTNQHYLLKYKKDSHNAGFDDLPSLTIQNYRFQGSFILDDQYLALSEVSIKSNHHSVSVELLRGAANCPCCSNRYAMAICSCQNIFCIDNGGKQTCPHCGMVGIYGFVNEDFEIKRKQG